MRRRPMRFQRQGGTRASRGLMRSSSFILVLAAFTAIVALVPSSAAASLPQVTASIDGVSGTNGWWRGSTHGNLVVLHWTVSATPPLTNTVGCEPAITISGPTAGVTKTCAATNDDGTVSIPRLIKIDADPPAGVTASVARGPDFNGWYNHAVGVSWGGADATSGLAGCTSLTYTGPDGASAPVGGGCTDMAGNTASAPITLKYDATPPVLKKVSVTSGPDADSVRWISSSPSDKVVVQRAVRGGKTPRTVFRGTGTRFSDKKIQDGLEYTYTVQTTDQAGNASRRISAAGLPKVLTLRKTPYVPRAAGRPILRWEPARGATYYNVQLFRGSKRVFAAWPTRARLGLPATWKWAGHRYRLRAGHYRWYVWAGLGRRSFARYKTLGSAQFIVPRG
jgi:hypothetical protein